MKAKIQIRDSQTNELLEQVGSINYSNTGIAIQQCENWYAEEIDKWAERNYSPEIVLVDID